MLESQGIPSPKTQTTLGQVCTVTAGPSASLLQNLYEGADGTPVVTPRDITAAQTIQDGNFKKLPTSEAEQMSRFSLNDGDILVVRQGIVGRAALVKHTEESWLFNSALIRVRPNHQLIQPEFLLAYLNNSPAWHELIDLAVPSTVRILNSSLLRDLPISIPSLDDQYRITQLISNIEVQIQQEKAIISRLEMLRPAVFQSLLRQLDSQ